MNIEPRVRFQAQYLSTTFDEWWDAGDPQKTQDQAKTALANPATTETRIVKQTTTFEVVEEMEPSK